MGTTNKISIFVAILVMLLSTSCATNNIKLTADSDPTPPELVLLVNMVPAP